jgi:hypothetical protein
MLKRLCAIAAELSTRGSNAIAVINFRIMDLPSCGPPHDHREEKPDRKIADSPWPITLQ